MGDIRSDLNLFKSLRCFRLYKNVSTMEYRGYSELSMILNNPAISEIMVVNITDRILTILNRRCFLYHIKHRRWFLKWIHLRISQIRWGNFLAIFLTIIFDVYQRIMRIFILSLEHLKTLVFLCRDWLKSVKIRVHSG